jgi:hypothetical protein
LFLQAQQRITRSHFWDISSSTREIREGGEKIDDQMRHKLLLLIHIR